MAFLAFASRISLRVTRCGAVASTLAFAACSSKAAPPAPRGGSAAASPARAVIDIGELSVRFDDIVIARLHADGTSESMADATPTKDAKLTPGPRFHADGTIDLTKGGAKVRVNAEGDIILVSPPGEHQPDRLFAHMSGNQIVAAGGGHNGVRLEGARLVMFSDTQTTFIGAVDPPLMGQTAMIMSVAFLIDTTH